MNPSVNSTPEEHGEPSWPSESWDHPVAAVCCGLDSRHFQVSRFDWEWDNPAILAQQHSIDLVDCKPSSMQTDAIATGQLRQYNGLLSNTFPSSSNLCHNPWSLLNAQPLRNGEGIDQSLCPTFAPPSAAALYGLGGNSGLSGYYAGNGGYSEARLPYDPHRHLLGLVNFDQRRLQDIMKRDICSSSDLTARLGLNLGGRTYFSAEDNSLARFGKRPRPNSPGIIVPLCQAEGCKADLSNAKHYHRRHKVCEFHSKAATVMIGGQTQRFCQQCSRFHILSEFDEGKRSCRKRLADHNRRRRKPQPNSSTSGSCTTESAAQKTDGHDGHAADNHNSNGGQTKTSASADQSQALASAMSLAQSVPVMIQNGKKQLCANSSSNEKETYQQFMEGSRAGPSLSLSPFSGGAAIAPQGQASGKGFGKVDLPVTWLKPSDSSSNLMESAASINNLSDSGSPKRQFVESAGSSSSIQALSHSIQNLMPISTSRDHSGNSDWKMKHISDQEREQLAEFGSSNINLQRRSEGQEVLSLLEGGSFPEHQRKQKAQAPLDFIQHELSATINMNEADYPTTEKKPDIKFSGLQGLRQFNRSIYNTENVP